MASGVVVVLGIVLDLAEIARGILSTPAGSVVVAVGCTVLQMWRGGILWALQVRVLRAPAVAGRVAVPDPLGQRVGVRTKEVRASGC